MWVSTTSSLADQVGVRVRFGVGDTEPGVWDGSVTVADGKLLGIDGWRFQQMDGVVDATSWKAQTRRAAARRTNNPKQANANRNNSPVMDNGILLAIDDVKPTTRVAIKTKQGDFEFAISDLAMGKSIPALGKRIEIERTASTTAIASTTTDDDFPSLANGPNGLVALATETVTVPSRLVEVCIAATIVYVAIENLFRDESPHRWRITFVFGLIHGFGFANVLRDLGLPREGLVRCLLAFNCGVELGQLVIVASLWPLWRLVSNTKRGPLISRYLSGAILACGSAWLIDRLFGLEWMPF